MVYCQWFLKGSKNVGRMPVGGDIRHLPMRREMDKGGKMALFSFQYYSLTLLRISA